MHGHVYSSRDGIRVIPPYGEGAFDYSKGNTRLSVKENVRSAVALMLADYAAKVRDGAKAIGMREPSFWWENYEYTISIREDYTARGTYVYSVDKEGE
jgi:hypothetical protein